MSDFTASSDLLGKWVTDPLDLESLRRYGHVTLEFTEDGRLIYTIHSKRKFEKIILTYRVQNESLITNQPSAPREERTPFSLTPDGKLTLIYGGHKTSYCRVDDKRSTTNKVT